MTVLRRLALALAFVLVATGPATAAEPAAAPLGTRLARALEAPGLEAVTTGAVVVDLASGQVVFERNPSVGLAPASTEKLAVALTALSELGAEHRLRTLVVGRGTRDGAVWRGDVGLKGFGDPSLASTDLTALAARVRSSGIRRVTGRVIGDESYFDDRRTAPGWKASFYKNESPPLSALVVDRAQRAGRTSDAPALAAARSFRAALEAAGVEVDGAARVGTVDADRAEVLAKDVSPRLDVLVAWMNTASDNFVAEMLLKTLGASRGGPGTTRAGVRVVRDRLADLGVRLAGVRLLDGSGLSYEDRLTANALVDILQAGRSDPELAKHFVDSLAVAGRTGTLEDRLERGPAAGIVVAKTGTTRIASSLAGFVGERYAFAILMNAGEIDYWRARKAQDRFVTLLARHL
jgi:D-alanyl-D-alanine carboxypeptidase/D-alanyl-D-alanine-endopeptidase (penicillin-binding protein 4)